MSREAKIQFKCSHCGEEEIQEILFSEFTESIVSPEITLDDDGHCMLEYDRSWGGGDVTGCEYKCNGCGMMLADSTEDLLQYLRDNHMIQEGM